MSVAYSGGSVPMADGYARATAIGVTCDTRKCDINGWDAAFRSHHTDQVGAAQRAVQLKCTASWLIWGSLWRVVTADVARARN